MWAPVSDAARTTSSAPSIRTEGVVSTSSRLWVNVGTPALDASRATSVYSTGSTPGA
jgi:hypothetical protein